VNITIGAEDGKEFAFFKKVHGNAFERFRDAKAAGFFPRMRLPFVSNV